MRRATMMGREVVVKCRELSTWWKRVKFGVGMGHGAKQWRGAERLMKAGIATGRPLCVARAEVDGRVCEVMVLEFVAGKTLLEILDEVKRGVGPGVREQHRIARAVGNQIRTMMDGYCANRDHKPSNLVVRQSEDGRWEIAVIDCVGIGGRVWGLPHVDEWDWDDMLTSPMIEPIGCGCAPRRALWMRGLCSIDATPEDGSRKTRHRFLRKTAKRIEVLVKAHGDPRPRVDPLGSGRQRIE